MEECEVKDRDDITYQEPYNLAIVHAFCYKMSSQWKSAEQSHVGNRESIKR